MKTESTRHTAVWPVYIALALLIVFAGIFLFEFLGLSGRGGGAETLTSETYMDTVTPLLENADPEQGAALVRRYGCAACHMGVNAGRLAPPFSQVAQIAGERRPPLAPVAYVYESIVYPGAFEVQGYSAEMPRIFGEQIPDNELGDIIAYLLEPGATE